MALASRKEAIERLEKLNPTKLAVGIPVSKNPFEILSASPANNFVQKKISLYTQHTKRARDEYPFEFSVLPSAKKGQKQTSLSPSFASREEVLPPTADSGEGGAAGCTVPVNATQLDKQGAGEVENFQCSEGGGISSALPREGNKSSFADIAAGFKKTGNDTQVHNDQDLRFSSEMQQLGGCLNGREKDPFFAALMSYLDKLNGQLHQQNDKIRGLEAELLQLRSTQQDSQKLLNKGKIDRELAARRAHIDKAERTTRIVGIEVRSRSNKQVIRETIDSAKCQNDGGSSANFQSTKLIGSKNNTFTSLHLCSNSVEQKIRVDNNCRSAGLTVRQSLPASLIPTFQGIRKAYLEHENFVNAQIMVKLARERIVISSRACMNSSWTSVESLNLPASKSMINLGIKQGLSSKIVDLSKVPVPSSYF